MLHYIIQTIAFQLFFLLAYDVFLKKETFFNWNRLYLLVTAVLSLVLPFIKLHSLKTVIPQDYVVSLPEVVLGQTTTYPNHLIDLDAVVLKQNSISFWEIIFYTGLCIACCLFLFKVIRIVALVLKNPKQSIGKIVLVELINSTAAFSFFNYIFLGGQIKSEDKETIIKHELIHAQQKHTLDLLFFEVLRILFWFNPLVYMYQSRIRTLHEFIADAHAVKHQNKNEYYQNLLAQVFQTERISFINTFFKQSLIKKRIVMLQKSKSKQIHLIKYVLLIPMVFGMLVYTSAEAQDKETQKKTSQVITEVQDLSDEDLKERLRSELKKMKAENADFQAIAKAFIAKNKNYILNKEDYFRYQIYYKEAFGKSKKSNRLKPNNIINKTYAEYLEYKKTDEAKETWENNTYDGTLKLVVNDIGNLTTEEKNKYNKKKKQLFNDNFFTNFIMTDGKRAVSLAQTDSKGESNQNNNQVIEVPFAVIDQVPVYPGCENRSKEEQKQCISNKISKHVAKNFRTDLATELGLVGRQRINVIFKIDKEGNVTGGVRSRAPHPDLETEAIRVIKLLPKMVPGKHNGKNVIVPYSLPIIFQVAEKAEGKQPDLIPLDEVEVPFAVIENVPVYPGCEDLESNAQKKICMSEKLTKFVIENFNTKKASEYELVGRQRINVIFKIDTKGNIIGVRSRGPHPALEAEAIRVISSLPKMKPGMQKGKAVTVPYSLPIVFEVEDTQLLDKVIVDKNSDEVDVTVPFEVIDKAPILPECESLETEKEKRQCTTNGISQFVNKNFNTKLAKELGLKGRQRINVVFKITKKGHIAIEKSRASHPDLEAEAIRVIKSIPKLIPGEHKGKKVDVIYSMPIVFQVQK